jgi:hypothetical protein
MHPEAVVDSQDFMLDADKSAVARAHRESVPPPRPKPSLPQHG